MKDIDIVDSIQEATAAINAAKQYNLEAEVVTWALIEMKTNPKLEIGEALNLSVQEWLK